MNRRSWFAVEGSLEPIDYDGPSFFRFPEAVAGHVIERYSAPGDWVIDPFCGFGTTLVVAERLGRHAAGCEADQRRAAFSASRLANPDRVMHGRCEDLAPARWPPCALLFTSPPYGSFRSGDHDDDPVTYLADARRLFSGFAQLLGPGATVAVEVSQLRQGNRTRVLVFDVPLAAPCSLAIGTALAGVGTWVRSRISVPERRRVEVLRSRAVPPCRGPRRMLW